MNDMGQFKKRDVFIFVEYSYCIGYRLYVIENTFFKTIYASIYIAIV